MFPSRTSSKVAACLMLIGCGAPGAQNQREASDSVSLNKASVSTNTRAGTDTFALIDIGGRQLPTSILSVPMTRCREDLSVGEDLLVLQPDSVYQRRRIGWHGCPDAIAATRDTLRRSGQYRLSGDSLVLTFGDGSEVERELIGRMHGDTITVSGQNAARAFHYRRRIRP